MIQEFKQAGKKVVAAGDGFDHTQYYLASCADEIFMQEGLLLLEGYGRFATFYKEGIDKLEIDWNVFRVGEYKSAVEPFLRNDMSPEAKEANRASWRTCGPAGSRTSGPLARRSRRRCSTASITSSTPARSFGAGGHGGAEGGPGGHGRRTGRRGEAPGRAHARGQGLALVSPDRLPRLPEDGSTGSLGGERARRRGGGHRGQGPDPRRDPAARPHRRRLDRRARASGAPGQEDEVVLRVDSGGGSAFASEVIREELRARAAGKPVVVSMGSVAASGGYWIATSSDEIWASPSTVTGSIGIFGMFPVPEAAREAPRRPRRRRGHDVAVGRAAPGPGDEARAQGGVPGRDPGGLRGLPEARRRGPQHGPSVDHIARGRVWSGEDAKGIKLVDQLGGLDQAVASAAKRAKLGERYRIWYVEKEPTFKERLATSLLTWTADWVVAAVDQAPSGWSRRRMRALRARGGAGPVQRPARDLRGLPVRGRVALRLRAEWESVHRPPAAAFSLEPFVVLASAAALLTLLQFHGTAAELGPILSWLERGQGRLAWAAAALYRGPWFELASYAYWSLACFAGYLRCRAAPQVAASRSAVRVRADLERPARPRTTPPALPGHAAAHRRSRPRARRSCRPYPFYRLLRPQPRSTSRPGRRSTRCSSSRSSSSTAASWCT